MTGRTQKVSRAAVLAAGAIVVALGLAAPAAAAPGGDVIVVDIATNVPFSKAELAEALHVRGVAWSRQIRVRFGPSGWALLWVEGARLEVDLEGRKGAAAARVVALALIAEYGTAKETAPAASPEASSIEVAAAAPPGGAPVAADILESPAKAVSSAPARRRWLTFGPSLAVGASGPATGTASGLAAGLDLASWRYVRITSGLTVVGAHLVAATSEGMISIENRSVAAQVGLAFGTDLIAVHLGPQLEFHHYQGPCATTSHLLAGGYGAIRGVWPLGGRVGLVAAASHSRTGSEVVNWCFVGDREFAIGRTDTSLMAGVALGL